jgi:hypothetical protein
LTIYNFVKDKDLTSITFQKKRGDWRGKMRGIFLAGGGKNGQEENSLILRQIRVY